MDDLLVVLITLAIAGAGALGQLKKKKQETQAVSGNLDNPEDIWELFKNNTIAGNLVDDPYGDKEDFVSEPGPAVNEQSYTFNPKNEGGKTIEPAVAKPAIIKKNQPVLTGKFPLRQAIIYSEILNRKYF